MAPPIPLPNPRRASSSPSILDRVLDGAVDLGRQVFTTFADLEIAKLTARSAQAQRQAELEAQTASQAQPPVSGFGGAGLGGQLPLIMMLAGGAVAAVVLVKALK